MKTNNYPKVVAFDFDETIGLCDPKNKYDSYLVKQVNTVPNPRMVKLIKKLRKQKIKVIIYSSRWWGDYNALVEWLAKHKIVVDDVVLGRLKADVYICDKSLNAHDSDVIIRTAQLLGQSDAWGIHFDKYFSKKKTKVLNG